MNLVVEDFDESMCYFCEVYGVEFVMDLFLFEFYVVLIGFGGGFVEIFVFNVYFFSV